MQDTEEVSGGDLFTVHKVYNPLSLSVVYSNLENKFNNCAVLSLPLSNVWKITLFILSLTSLYGSREHRCLCALTDMGNDGLFFSALLYIPRSVCYLCYSRSNS